MNIFRQFIYSLCSPKIISIFRFQGIGKAILYVFLLSLIASFPSAFQFSENVIQGVLAVENATKMENYPSFTIDNGILSSTMKEPFFFEEDDFIFIVDSTASINRETLHKNSKFIAFLQNEVIITMNNRTDIIQYSILDIPFTHIDLAKLIVKASSSLPIILPFLLALLFFITSASKFIETTVLGFIGLLIKNAASIKLKYRHTWILAAYSMTIPTAFFIVMDAFQLIVPAGGLLYWTIASIVLFLVIKEIPSKKRSTH